jgi:hypothetical protein
VRLFNLLVKQVEACCGDGVGCERCAVAVECVAYWDTMCQRPVITRCEYSAFANRFAELRSKKWRMSIIQTMSFVSVKQGVR